MRYDTNVIKIINQTLSSRCLSPPSLPPQPPHTGAPDCPRVRRDGPSCCPHTVTQARHCIAVGVLYMLYNINTARISGLSRSQLSEHFHRRICRMPYNGLIWLTSISFNSIFDKENETGLLTLSTFLLNPFRLIQIVLGSFSISVNLVAFL